EFDWAKARLPDAQSWVLKARAELTRAQDDHARKCQVARGQFDGRCPVAGVKCPATSAINADWESGQDLLKNAEQRLDAAGHEHREGKPAPAEGEGPTDAAVKLDGKISTAESKLAGMALSLERVERLGHPPEEKLPDPAGSWAEVSAAD